MKSSTQATKTIMHQHWFTYLININTGACSMNSLSHGLCWSNQNLLMNYLLIQSFLSLYPNCIWHCECKVFLFIVKTNTKWKGAILWLLVSRFWTIRVVCSKSDSILAPHLLPMSHTPGPPWLIGFLERLGLRHLVLILFDLDDWLCMYISEKRKESQQN